MTEARERLRANLDQALEKLDVPRRSDLQALQQRLDRLTEQVEALLARSEE